MRRRGLTIGIIALACAAAVTVSVVVATRAGTERHQPAATVPPTTARTPGAVPPTTARSAHSSAEAAPAWSLIATTKGTIPRYASPGARQDGAIPARWYGGVSALPVIAQRPGWLHVRLATRPNGSTAWVRQADVTLTATPYRIAIDLTTRRLTLFRLRQKIMDAPAGVGVGQDPTPTGHYFVAFFEPSPNPGYGPFIMVTSAHSAVFTDWEGSGDGVIGIHGPLGASSRIGTTGAYLTHGCIRLQVPDLDQLRNVPAGSPITITG